MCCHGPPHPIRYVFLVWCLLSAPHVCARAPTCLQGSLLGLMANGWQAQWRQTLDLESPVPGSTWTIKVSALLLSWLEDGSTSRSTHLAADLVLDEVMNTGHQTSVGLLWKPLCATKVPGSEHKHLLSKPSKRTHHDASVLSLEGGQSLLNT